MRDTGNSTEDQALDWVIRMRDPAFDGWEPFEAWLSADPAHADAYHAMAMADQDLEAIIPPAPALIVHDVPRRPARRLWIGGALAASFAALIGYSVMPPAANPYVVETPAGARQTVALRDGSRIELNGGTKVILDLGRPREAELAYGEAVFTVVHDDAHPFRVEVGGATLLDAGTVFNVVRERGVTSVAVAEGAVIYNPDAEAVSLAAGKTLRAADGDTQLVVAQVDTGGIAAWREGQLVYDGAPLEQVAADLTRNLGVRVSAAPNVAGRSFRGVIALGRDRESLLATRLGPLLDVRVARDRQGWILTADSP